MTYEAWRIGFQDSEQAARAAWIMYKAARDMADEWKKRYEGMAILHANKVRMIENGDLVYSEQHAPNLNSTTPNVRESGDDVA